MSTPARTTPIAPYHDESEWLAARRTGLGGSDIAAIFQLHPWKSPHDVWLDKMGKAVERKETPDMRRGKRLEETAAQLYMERTGRRVRLHHMRRHREFPHLVASIDRQILAGKDAAGNDYPTGALEIKVPRTRNFYTMKFKGLPDYIILQGQHEALVCVYPYTAFGIYGPDDDAILSFDVPFHADVSRRIIEVGGDWWHTHIELGKEPAKDAVIPDIKELPEVKGEVTYRTDEQWAAAANDYFEARELVKSAEALKEQAKQRIKQLAGGPGIYEQEGVNRFYYATVSGRRTFDPKALAANKPLDSLAMASELVNQGIHVSIVEAILDKCRLNVDAFYKTGKPFEELRGFLLHGLEDE